MHRSEVQPDARRRWSGRDSIAALARRPGVQALLIATVVMQTIGTVAAIKSPSEAVGVTAPSVTEVALEPVRAEPDSTVRMAWLEQALVREAERIGGEYRSEGYQVTTELAGKIGKAAAEFDIEPEVAFGLVRAESSFRNTATSPVGAVGLTQLMPRTASWIEPGVTRAQLRDPETNLRVGFKYLRYLLDKYEGDERLALLAYNRGPGTVDRELRRGGNPDNGYADFVYGEKDHGHRLFTR